MTPVFFRCFQLFLIRTKCLSICALTWETDLGLEAAKMKKQPRSTAYAFLAKNCSYLSRVRSNNFRGSTDESSNTRIKRAPASDHAACRARCNCVRQAWASCDGAVDSR